MDWVGVCFMFHRIGPPYKFRIRLSLFSSLVSVLMIEDFKIRIGRVDFNKSLALGMVISSLRYRWKEDGEEGKGRGR